MHIHLRHLRRWTVPLVALLATLLASCGVQTDVMDAAAADEIAHVLTIDIAADAEREALASAYDAQVLSFQPEAGFAILGLRPGADRIFPQAETNVDALAVAEAHGFSAWAGGFSAWAGGFSAWAGGFSAWAGGVGDNPFPENLEVWQAIGLDTAHTSPSLLGAGATVAVIDTGVDIDHTGLSGKLAPDDAWFDYVDDDGNPDEVANGSFYGHGTAVAGIILQVAPEATILPLRVLGADGYGDLADVVAAIDRALAHGADVINLSLGSSGHLAALEQMIAYAASQGVPVIASAGNTDGSVLYPAAYAPGYALLTAVGSVDAGGAKSGFSAFGNEISLMAHGEGIGTLYPDDRKVLASGTSFAAPFAAGSAALAMAQLEQAELDASLKQVLRSYVYPFLQSASDASIYDKNKGRYKGTLGAGSLRAGGFFLQVLLYLDPYLGGSANPYPYPWSDPSALPVAYAR